MRVQDTLYAQVTSCLLDCIRRPTVISIQLYAQATSSKDYRDITLNGFQSTLYAQATSANMHNIFLQALYHSSKFYLFSSLNSTQIRKYFDFSIHIQHYSPYFQVRIVRGFPVHFTFAPGIFSLSFWIFYKCVYTFQSHFGLSYC